MLNKTKSLICAFIPLRHFVTVSKNNHDKNSARVQYSATQVCDPVRWFIVDRGNILEYLA